MIMLDDIYKFKYMEYDITPLPYDTVPTMAYVPYQIENKTYSPEQGLCKGTMFPVLNKPFLGCGGKENER